MVDILKFSQGRKDTSRCLTWTTKVPTIVEEMSKLINSVNTGCLERKQKAPQRKLNSAFTLENMQKSESSSGEEVQSSKLATDISTSITLKHHKSSFAFAGLKDVLLLQKTYDDNGRESDTILKQPKNPLTKIGIRLMFRVLTTMGAGRTTRKDKSPQSFNNLY